jgi:hypothetical protein
MVDDNLKHIQEELQFEILVDSKGHRLMGDKKYIMHVPASIPQCNFWSAIIYDDQTKLIIKTDQAWPSIHSQMKEMVKNDDGTLNIFFGPDNPSGKNNWLKTVPGNGWYLIFRLYGTASEMPLAWKPGEIQEMG